MRTWWEVPGRLIADIGLWRGLAWGVAAVALWDGSGYFAEGNRVAHNPSQQVLKEVPGGFRTHGVVMLLLAVAIIYTSHDRPVLARRVMLAVWIYSVWLSVATIAGWYVSHAVTWSAPSKWFLIAWISILLSATADRMKPLPATRE